jgi:hypothetical protein
MARYVEFLGRLRIEIIQHIETRYMYMYICISLVCNEVHIIHFVFFQSNNALQ